MVKSTLSTPPPLPGWTERHKVVQIAHDRAFGVTAMHLLIEQWEQLAIAKFKSAEAQADEASRRFVEYGASCYFNCAQELRAALDSALSAISVNQLAGADK